MTLSSFTAPKELESICAVGKYLLVKNNSIPQDFDAFSKLNLVGLRFHIAHIHMDGASMLTCPYYFKHLQDVNPLNLVFIVKLSEYHQAVKPAYMQRPKLSSSGHRGNSLAARPLYPSSILFFSLWLCKWSFYRHNWCNFKPLPPWTSHTEAKKQILPDFKLFFLQCFS